MQNRVEIVKDFYEAFKTGNREFVEQNLSDNFSFSAPPDPQLDLTGYFERCWPHAGQGMTFEFVRFIESGNEVVVTYESPLANGNKGRNTEIITFAGDKIERVEVYFGWTIDKNADR